MTIQHTHSIEEQYRKLTRAIHRESSKALKQQPVTLIAVSKTRPAEDVLRLIQCGHLDFGENYLQEAIQKIEHIRQQSITQTSLQKIYWHFIGPIQSNKTQPIATHFDWVHTIDRPKIVDRLAQQRPPELPPLNLCIQVNIDHSTQKAGVPPELGAIKQLGALIDQAPRLTWRGLMCIPDVSPSQTTATLFDTMADLLAQLKDDHPHLDTLSMGMSSDFALAIRAGATQVRIGTELFGERNTA